MVAGHAGERFRFGQVRSVAVDGKLHTTSMEADHSVWVRGAIVKQLHGGSGGSFGSG